MNQVNTGIDKRSKKILAIVSDILSEKLAKTLVDDIIEVKDVLLVDSVYDGKRDKAYKVIWDFVERAERFIPEHDGYSLSYSQYGGYNDFDDDTINSAFEGDPEMTWNVD